MAVSYLKLVRDRTIAPAETRPKFEYVQESLLPARERTLAICTADVLTEAVIRELVQTLTPRIVLDFRTAPRFDFGSLNRGKVLDLFSSFGSEYFDGGVAIAGQAIDSDAIAAALVERAKHLESAAPTSTALVLLDAGADFQRVGLSAINRLRAGGKRVWELLLFGPTTQDDSDRKIIFISHANPEDNELAFWLQMQLTRLGYETWADVSQLKAGEVFWDTIEETIRDKASRVIALISRKAMQKAGVLDEISLAVSVERTRKLKGFVIPVRVDDTPYSEFRANIARKNIVDFSTSWASGLSAVAAALAQDRVPRQRQSNGLSLGKWWEERRPPVLSVVKQPERLDSNRFEVLTFPTRVYLFSGTPHTSIETMLPLVPYRGHFLAFFSERELADRGIGGLAHESTLSADDLFAGNTPLTAHVHPAARTRLRHAMLNRQWLVFLMSRGLALYTQSGLQPTPFIPDGVVTNNTATFVDTDGKQRKRLVVGYSQKRALYWHLAPVGTFSSATSTTLSLRLRVLFSSDGRSEWPTLDRIRTTRRSFCKNWWNDRWLSLQSAFMSWLSAGKRELSIYSGDAGLFTLEAAPVSYLSPCSIREAHATPESESELEKELTMVDEEGWLDSDLDAAEDGFESGEPLR